SLVTPDRLRFDFTHFGSVKPEELDHIAQIVNEKIWASLPLDIQHKGIEEAKAMGAMALFGEKYGDIVRVVPIDDYSTELFGGRDVRKTGEIGLYKIVSDTGMGAGKRRIETVTSTGAYEVMNEKLPVLHT